MDDMKSIEYDQFASIEIRSGTIVKAEPFERARNPSYKLWVDFGEFGIKQSSAQITQNYQLETLVGKKVLGVLNLGKKNIAGFMSEFLLVGFSDKAGNIQLSGFEGDVENGQKLH